MARQVTLVQIRTYKDRAKAEAAIELLRSFGIKASTNVKDFGRKDKIFSAVGPSIWVRQKDSVRASKTIEAACRFAAQPDKTLHLPPEEGTLEYLDMLIHDCRQYLMIATGELKDISEEGELELDDPTENIGKITTRLKRLKDQCMKIAGKRPLDWQR